MNNLIENKKARIIVVVAILLVVALIVLYFLDKRANQGPTLPFEVKTTQVNKAQVPGGMPANLPMEAGTKILQNYESRANDGRLQSTSEFTSYKQPREALDVYVDFFKKEGYEGGFDEQMSSVGKEQFARMIKANNLVLIKSAKYNDKLSRVEISLTQSPQ